MLSLTRRACHAPAVGCTGARTVQIGCMTGEHAPLNRHAAKLAKPACSHFPVLRAGVRAQGWTPRRQSRATTTRCGCGQCVAGAPAAPSARLTPSSFALTAPPLRRCERLCSWSTPPQPPNPSPPSLFSPPSAPPPPTHRPRRGHRLCPPSSALAAASPPRPPSCMRFLSLPRSWLGV